MDDKTLITDLSEDVVLGSEMREERILVKDVSKQKITVADSISELSAENCTQAIFEVNTEPISGIIELIGCTKCELNINARVRLVSLVNCVNTEVHFHDNSQIGSIHTKGTKGTTVCLPDACNMIPANKDDTVLVSTATDDGMLAFAPLITA